MADRSPALAIRSRARGAIAGSLIAFGWAFYGASLFDRGARTLVIAASLIVTGTLVVAAVTSLRRARTLPLPTTRQASANTRTWRWFWLNLVGEVVLLNIAVALLGPPGLHIYWIPAIAAVVGLHFLPMAVFFRARSYWFVGLAMIAAALVAALLIARHPERAAALAHVEGLANAAILWLALAVGVADNRARSLVPAADPR